MVGATPTCWDSSMLKKSALTPATAPWAAAIWDSLTRLETVPGVSRSTETCRSVRSAVTRCPDTTPCEPVTENAR